LIKINKKRLLKNQKEMCGAISKRGEETMMNWQKQLAQYTPAQVAPNTPYPTPYQNYPAMMQAPYQNYPGMPVQGLPGGVYSQPNLPIQEEQIPAEVTAAAQAADLGMPTREYRKSAANSNPLGIGVQSIIRWTFISVGITLLAAVAIILFAVPAPFNWIVGGVTLVSILPFIPMMLKFSKSFGGGSANKAFVAWSAPEGLVYSQDRQLYTVRWDEIRQIWRKQGMLNGIMSTLAYTIEPANGTPFSFSLLNGAFADYALGGNGGGSLSVSFGGGSIHNNGGFVQIMGNYTLSEYAGLGELIEEQLTQRTLSRLVESYRAGNAISFGPFTLRQQGMSDGMRELAWHEVDQIQITGPAVQITKKPTSTVWFNLPAAALPNFALLCAVLNTLKG